MPEGGLAEFFETLLPVLGERDRRVAVGAMAEALGRGGQARVAEASGMSSNTVSRAVREVRAGVEPSDRQRAPGGGAKPAIDKQPGLLEALDELVWPETRGHPMSPLRWTLTSTYVLARELTAQGFTVSAELVRRLLGQMGYSLQAPSKQVEGTSHPDRDGQFRYLNDRVAERLAAGEPVISVDAKKSTWSGRPRGSDEIDRMERPDGRGAWYGGRISSQKGLIGLYANGGRDWRPEGDPERVNVHDFADPTLGEFAKATPYGVYDIGNDEGWVSVGDTADTAEFAVEAIRRWWTTTGTVRFPDATTLTITADGGGSNGSRVRAWKYHLAALAAETGLEITVLHYPPGTSKWNKIEHRLFSFISMNWRGRPLTSIRTMIERIGATTTNPDSDGGDGDPVAGEDDDGNGG